MSHASLLALGIVALSTALLGPPSVAKPPAAKPPATKPLPKKPIAPATIVEVSSLTFSPSSPTDGDEVTVSLTITNASAFEVAKIPWVIHLFDGNTTLASGAATNVAANTSFTVTAKWKALAGTRKIQGYVDPMGTLKNTAPAADQTHEIDVVVAPRVTYCFGAAGGACGDGANHSGPAGGCWNGRCPINAGSWEHDTCCWDHPNGYFCKLGATGDECHAMFDKAVARLLHYTWWRDIEFDEQNTTGEVDFEKYCAKAGTIVHEDDVQYCCAREARRLRRLELHPDKAHARRCR
jgi:hypothetical protein